MSKEYTLDELLNNRDIKKSPVDTHGVIFFESKKLNIHEYRDAAGKKVAGTTSVIGDIMKSDFGFSIALESDGLIDNTTLDKAATRGTRIHEGIEHVLKNPGKDIPAGILETGDMKHIKAFQKWQTQGEGKVFDWSRVKSEVSGYSKELNAAGTTDIFVPYKDKINGKEVWHAWEIKTTSEIHRGAALQQAANIQQGKENFEELRNADRIDRGILHFPDSGSFKTVSDRRGNAPYKSLAEDTAEFKEKSLVYNVNSPNKATEERIRELASSKLYEQVHGTPDYKNIYLGVDEQGNVNPVAHAIYEEEAEKLGFAMKHEGLSSTGKSNKYSVSKIKDGDPERLKLAKAVLASSKKKEESATLGGRIKKELDEIKSISIGETLESANAIGNKIGGDLLSAITRTDNFRAAAVGGAIGYAGGLAYGALHDNSDPTSTYQTDRHILGNAIRGSIVGGAAAFSIAAGMGMRNVESGVGEMVAHVGNSARGMGGKLSDAVLGAWRATGRMK